MPESREELEKVLIRVDELVMVLVEQNKPLKIGRTVKQN